MEKHTLQNFENEILSILQSLYEANKHILDYLSSFESSYVSSVKSEIVGIYAKVENLDSIAVNIVSNCTARDDAKKLISYVKATNGVFRLVRTTKLFLTAVSTDMVEFKNDKKVVSQLTLLMGSVTKSFENLLNMFVEKDSFNIEKTHRKIVVEYTKSFDIYLSLEADIMQEASLEYEQKILIINSIKYIIRLLDRLENIASIILFDRNGVKYTDEETVYE